MKTNNDTTAMSVKEAYKRLEKEMADITSNKGWLEYLSFQSKFYQYSPKNVLLIQSQKPDALYVAGYNQWKKMNRHVRKNERSIKILAPVKRKERLDEEEECVIGFRLVSVFDLSQTDGPDDSVPIMITGLKNDDPSAESLYSRIISSIDVPVEEIPDLEVKGRYHTLQKRIEINASLPSVHRVKTLFHEWAHHIHCGMYPSDTDRSLREVLAEASAYVVSQHLGLDTTDYSVGYIFNWNEKSNHFLEVAGKVQNISMKIINQIIKAPVSL